MVFFKVLVVTAGLVAWYCAGFGFSFSGCLQCVWIAYVAT